MGIFISFYFILVNDLFPRQVGISNLSLAFVASGVLGYIISFLYNKTEARLGFMKAATIFTFLFSVCVGLICFFYISKIHTKVVVFMAYTWFWVASNYLNLVFWKIPALYFDLGENKQYNGWISTGEVMSSIVAYSLVFLFKFNDYILLSISGLSMLAFLILFVIIRIRLNKIIPKKTNNKPVTAEKISLGTIWKNDYFKFILGAIFFAIVIQLLVDYSLLDATAHELTDVKERKGFLAFWYMIMRILEFILKTVISRIIIKELGLFVGLISIISALSLIVIGGLISVTTGFSSSIVIFSTLNKVLERSIFRSIYAPTINILYQAYPIEMRSVSQNYADGYGKTFGQITAGILILAISQLNTFNVRILLVFGLISVILLLWFLVSKKLIKQYKLELGELIIRLKKNSEREILALLPLNLDNATNNIADQKLLTLFNHNQKHASFNEIERLWFRTVEKFKDQRKTDFQVDMLVVYVYLKYYNELPEQKMGSALRTLLNVDKYLYSTILAETKIIIDKSKHHQIYIQLLQRSISDFTYVMVCIHDLKNASPALKKLLDAERLQCLFDILYTLRAAHDRDVFDQIIPMIMSGERSQEMIAFELLELMLTDEEKIWALPSLREKNPTTVIHKLEEDFPQTFLSLESRLLSILGKNAMQLSEFTRYIALRDWIEISDSKTIKERIPAFGFSTEPFMKHLAHEYIFQNQSTHFSDYIERTGFNKTIIKEMKERILNLDQILQQLPDNLLIMLVHPYLRATMEGLDIQKNKEGYQWITAVFPEHSSSLVVSRLIV